MNARQKKTFNNILVTGGSGFIGSHFVLYILKNYPEAQVINFDKLTYAANPIFLEPLSNNHQYKFIQGDILDTELVLNTLEKNKIDTIVHFAAESHVDNSINNPDVFIETNIKGTYQLLNAAKTYWPTKNNDPKKHYRFHHISTDEVFGSLTHNEKPSTETSTYYPNSPYSASKASSDHIVRAFHKTYQLPITISHCSNNYGPNQHPEKFIPKIIYSCLMKEPIPIYGTGANIREWLYVSDHCQMICDILHYGKISHSYNIGSPYNFSNLELCQLITKYFNHESTGFDYNSLITFVDDRAGHDIRYSLNMNKYIKEINRPVITNFKKALLETINFYKASYRHSKQKLI